MPVVASDSFDRADAALGTADTGGAWTLHNGSWAVSSNQAWMSAANGALCVASLNLSVSDVILQCDITPSPVRVWAGLAARVTDHLNNVALRMVAGVADTFDIVKTVAGVETVISNQVTGAISLGTPYRVKWTMTGSNHVATLTRISDGVVVATVSGSDAAFATNTKHGLWTIPGASSDLDDRQTRWNNFLVTNIDADAGAATGTGTANNAVIASPPTTVSPTLNVNEGVFAYATDPTATAGELVFDFVSGSVSLVLSGATGAAATNADAAVATATGAANTTTSTVATASEVGTSAGAGNTAQSSLKPSAGAPAGAGAANASTGTVSTASGSGAGVGAGNAATGSLHITAGAPTGAGTANNATVTVGTIAAATVAAGAGAANPSTSTVTTAAGSAAGTGTGNQATGQAVRPTATGAGTANDSTALVNTPTTTGTGAGTANNATVTATANAAALVASGVGTADPATVDGAVVSAGFGAGPGSVITYAIDPTPAEHAMVFDFVTGQIVLLLAYDPASSTVVNAAAAEATGTANEPSLAVAAPATTATSVGAADSATTGHEAAPATATALAHDASVTTTTTLDTAISAGIAEDATVTLGIAVTAALSIGVANSASAVTVIPDLNDRAIKITIRDHGHTVQLKRRS